MCLDTFLEFLFIKRTLNFLSVIISYFIFHWNGQLNLRNFKNLFGSPLSVTFMKQIFFFLILTLSPIENCGAKILPPNSGYKFCHTLFSFSLFFFLETNLMLSANFINRLKMLPTLEN